MTAHIGGPEDPQAIAERHAGYAAPDSRQFKILYQPTLEPVGWVGYWELAWRDEMVFEIGWSVLEAFQGKGIAAHAASAAIDLARIEHVLPEMHAFPSIHNEPSNAMCRRLGFMLVGECPFEYPVGRSMQANDWRFDLFSAPSG